MSFQNLGATGIVNIDGGGDSLIYEGTAGTTFSSRPAGGADAVATIGQHVVVTQTGVQALELHGFAGDDSSTSAAALPAS